MQVSHSLEQLQHVALNLRLAEVDVGVVEHAAEIVVHIGHDHVQSGALLAALALVVGFVGVLANGHYEDVKISPHPATSQQPSPPTEGRSDGSASSAA